jgi:acetyltransferase-like isoleucine patch superfamily enzyme
MKISSKLRPIARRLLSAHLPVGAVARPVWGLLYQLHVVGREGLLWAQRFFWNEPLFRGQCAEVGSGFRMELLPYLSGRGRIVIGNAVRLSGKPSIAISNRLNAQPQFQIGDGTFIGHGCHFGIAESIQIGRNCLLAGGVSVRDLDGHPVDAERRRAGEPTPPAGVRPVVIEDDVWIGATAIILKGVTIGARSIVGAGAVVSRDVPPDCVVAGNPARVVKELITPVTCPKVGAA